MYRRSPLPTRDSHSTDRTGSAGSAGDAGRTGGTGDTHSAIRAGVPRAGLLGGVLARLQRDEGVEVLLPHERLLLAQQVPALRAVYASARRATLTLAYRVRLGARDLGPGGRAPQHGEDAVDQLEVHGDKGEHAEQLLRVGEAEEFVAEDGAAGAHGVEEEEELGDGAEQEEVGLGVGGGGGEDAIDGVRLGRTGKRRVDMELQSDSRREVTR